MAWGWAGAGGVRSVSGNKHHQRSSSQHFRLLTTPPAPCSHTLPCSCHQTHCSIKVTAGGLEALIELGGGDMRRTLNLLQVRAVHSSLASLLVAVQLNND